MDTTQNTKDIETLFAGARAALPQLLALVEGLAADFGGVGFVGPIKTRESAMRKAQADFGGDYSRLLDLCRSTVMVNDGAKIADLFCALAERAKIVRVKDRFARPVMGYRDMLVNVEIDGHICEVQIHVRAILDVKEIIHPAYEFYRITHCPVAGAWMEIAYDHAFAGLL